MLHSSTLHSVRVEDETSIGRVYSKDAQLVPGLGLKRATLKTRSLDNSTVTLESMTMQRVHLAKATREQVMDYFHNTWELTTALFTGLKTDAGFYAVPDLLRRRLIFYFGHPAALYANKLHQAGLIGKFISQ